MDGYDTMNIHPACHQVNVQIIMEHLGGGGHMSIAGCQMEDVTIEEAIGILKHTIDTMIDDGEL